MELIALLLPILIDYVGRKVSDSDLRLWLSVGISAVVALFIVWIDTGFGFLSARAAFDYISGQIMMVFGLAQLSFHAVWSKTQTHTELRTEAAQS